MYWCSRCCDTHADGKHLPRWEVEMNCAFDGRPPVWEEARGAIGRDPQDAAERWAQRHDAEGDYTIVQGSPATIRLRPDVGIAEDRKEADWIVLRVSGRSDPTYRAERIERPATGGGS